MKLSVFVSYPCEIANIYIYTYIYTNIIYVYVTKSSSPFSNGKKLSETVGNYIYKKCYMRAKCQ